jgi:hypothetical protein
MYVTVRSPFLFLQHAMPEAFELSPGENLRIPSGKVGKKCNLA